MKLASENISCSIVIVNFNGRGFLNSCLDSLKRQSYTAGLIEILVVDNGSRDGSVELLHAQYPDVTVLRNSENNYAKALNLGIAHARGECIAFLNNDMVVEEDWLAGLVELLKSDERIGCVGGKVLLMNGRINSVGIQRSADFCFHDLGYGEKDRGQYERIEPRDGITGGAILWRRACLDDIGAVDEDYLMYFEDVDLALRCQANGWRMLYTPLGIAHHCFHGSSAGTDLCYYFCNRNRFLLVARYFPHALPGSLLTSHFYKNRQFEWLYESIPIALKKLYDYHPQEAVETLLPQMRTILTSIFGSEKTGELFTWMEVVLGLKRPSIAIYDAALPIPGEGQRYGCTVAQTLQQTYDITFLANAPVTLETLETWYHLDLGRCRLKVIPVPLVEEGCVKAMAGDVAGSLSPKPPQSIEDESAQYNIFVNANMASKVHPTSQLSVLFCHFPQTLGGRYVTPDQSYSIVASSEHAAERLKEVCGLTASAVIGPPVKAGSVPTPEEELIPARSFQHEITRFFGALVAAYTTIRRPQVSEFLKKRNGGFVHRTPWDLLPARTWDSYREGGPRVALSKTYHCIRARLLRW